MVALADYRSLFNLEGQVALVPGGTGGIGRAVCEGLAAFGATVVVGGRIAAKAEALASEIAAVGGRAWGAELDICRVERVRSLTQEIAERLGRLDIQLLSPGLPMPIIDTDELRVKRAYLAHRFARRPYFLIRARNPQLVSDEVERRL